MASHSLHRFQAKDSLRNWIAAVILVVAAVARFWGIHFGLPHLNARPDEGAIVSIAGGMSLGDLNPHFFNYPALFMTVVAAVHSLLPDPSDTVTPYKVARYLSAAAGVATVWVLLRVGTRLFGYLAGLGAAALLAVCFLHVRDSHFGVTDVPMTFLTVVAFSFIVRVFEGGVRRDVLAAGIASGLAMSTKYNAALVALPALVAILVKKDGLHEPLGERLRSVALYGSVMVATFLLTSPFTILEFREFLNDVTYESRHLAVGHKLILARGWIHHLTSSLRYGMGLPLLIAGIVGMIVLSIRNRRTAALVAAFPISYYVLLGSGYTVFARYIIPVVPFLCLTAAYAVTIAAEAIAIRIQRVHAKHALVALGILCLAWPPARSVVSFNRIISRTDSRVIARQWIERHVPPTSTIAELGVGGGHVLLFDGDPSEVKYTRADLTRPGARPDIVIVNSSPLSLENDLSPREVRILSRDYETAMTVHAVADHERSNVYDWQDDFFMPLGGFRNIERPGPNLTIYVRRSLP